MRRIEWLVGVAALVAGGAGAGGMACVFNTNVNDCSQYPCQSSGNGGSADAGPPKTCPTDPTAATVTGADLEGCGFFVNAGAAGVDGGVDAGDAGDAEGDGSFANPFHSLAAAATKTGGNFKQVYVCADTYTTTSTTIFSNGVSIYAGYTNCAGAWTWGGAGSLATLNGPANQPAIQFNGGTNEVTNLNVVAPGASAPGGSSIALVVNGGSLDIVTGSVTAGDAMPGTAGTSPVADMTLDGTAGANGLDACASGNTHPGATGAVNMCSTGGTSTGGNGGSGGDGTVTPLPAAGNGTAGTAMPTAGTAPAGAAGQGEGTGTPALTMCTAGQDGAAGTVGTSGPGGSGIGTLSVNGYQGADGTSGAVGEPAEGGGGGGGAKGIASGTCPSGPVSGIAGASGGSGGTGGCGGNPGTGGTAGGSSIAVLLIDATLQLGSTVTLTAGAGGAGGLGGTGQNGGAKGTAGTGGAGGSGNGACSGGNGGKGGDGGPGGGGQGGHSLGIAFQSTTAPAPAGLTSTITPGAAGAGGVGGANNTTTNMGAGANGQAAKCWNFTGNKSCG